MLNRSLFGLASEFALTGPGTLYGAPHGFEGILRDRCVNLSNVSDAQWESVADAPGAAIGSTRQRLRDGDVAKVFEYLDKLDIRNFFIIGGNDSAETGNTLQRLADEVGYQLGVINVPKTIDNDLVLTDHSPGYGSAARFITLAVMGSGRDAEAMRGASPITIMEVMGRDAGWLAASSALARTEERDAPHIICVPEIPVVETEFIARVESAYSAYGFAVAVIAENARGPDGVLGAADEPWFVDDFGHPYYDGPARYLAGRVTRSLGVRARYEKPGTIQRSLVGSASEIDLLEAEMVGRAAVTASREGMRGVMITLERDDSHGYDCHTGYASLEQVGGMVRTMPESFLAAKDAFVTAEFLDYVRPLVGPLPTLARLI